MMEESTANKAVSGRRRQIIMASLLVVIGLAGLLYALISSGQQRQKTADYVLTQGQVADHRETIGHDKNNSEIFRYAEIVVYQAGGKQYSITSSVDKTNPAPIGSTMDVKYNPADPQQAVLPAQSAQTFLITLIAGGILMLLGVFLIIKSHST